MIFGSKQLDAQLHFQVLYILCVVYVIVIS
jgi:hypothetical protein